MDCPRCKKALNAEQVRDVNIRFEIEQCPECEGAWFDQGELAKVDKIIEPVLVEFRNIPARKEQNKALTCPSCENLQLLKKVQHPRDYKVIVDYCPVCKGIWLDKGELEAIQKENYLLTLGKVFQWLIGKR